MVREDETREAQDADDAADGTWDDATVPAQEAAEDAVGGAGADDAMPEPAPDAAAEVERLRAELEAARAAQAAAEAQAQKHLEQARRTLADFENYKKRTRGDAAAAVERAKGEILREMLAVMDNFDRALEHAGDEESLYDGLKLIYRQLRNTMEAQGLRRVDAEGHAFDPQLHEAVMREPTAAYKEGVVIKELEKGYFLGERLLRPAKVKVAVAPPPGGASADADGSDGDSHDEAPT